MKNGIPADKYYFLLEWKDANMEEFISMKGGRRMCDLDTYELNKLYEAITANEAETNNESARTCFNCYYLPKKYDKYCDTCNGTNKHKQV